jgi:hypothetical protein
MTKFGSIRKITLNYWAEQTGREVMDDFGKPLLTDSFSGAYECDWQNNYNSGHVNLFCSLGDWACNLTDLLKDNRFDNLDLDNKEESIVLFRFYTRIMLITSELLTDFQDIYANAENLSGSNRKQIARKFYFPYETPSRITKILEYINHTCKHKTQHIHLCNNHLPLYFEDSYERKKRLNYISISDSSVVGKNAIQIPKLDYLIRAILTCYRKINTYFRKNKTNYLLLCQRYS